MFDFQLPNSLVELDVALDTGANFSHIYSSSAWIEIIASTSEDADFLLLYIKDTRNYSAIFELRIVSGSHTETIGKFLLADLAEAPFYALLPIKIPAGAQISIRGETTYGSPRTVRVSMTTYAGANVIGGTYIDCYGATSDPPEGVLLDWAGAANTKGAWTPIVTSTDRDLSWFGVVFETAEYNNGSSYRYMWYDIAIGASGSEVPIISDQQLMMTNYDCPLPGMRIYSGFFIPAGSRISIRYSYDLSIDPGMTAAIFGGG